MKWDIYIYKNVLLWLKLKKNTGNLNRGGHSKKKNYSRIPFQTHSREKGERSNRWVNSPTDLDGFY